MKNNRLAIVPAFFALLSVAAAPVLRAAGFQNPPPGPAAAGGGGAFTARADDPTAVTHNPAGLVQLEGSHLILGSTVIRPRAEYTDGGGNAYRLEDETHFLPDLYFVAPAGRSGLRFGLGVTVPFGQGTGWPTSVPFANEVYASEMKTLNINPTAAWLATPDLSLGAGVNYLRSEITETGALQPFPGGRKISLDGAGWGYNLGLLYRLNRANRLGLSYRSRVPVDHRGVFAISPLPPSPPAPPLPAGGTATLNMDFPATAAAGWAFQPGEKWTVELNLEWTRWSALARNRLEIPALGLAAAPYQAWRDTWSARLGVECRPDPRWTWWAGYLYLPSPIPDHAFHPRLPDADASIVTAGCRWSGERLSLALGQEFSFPRTRTISRGEPWDGVYRSFNHLTTVSVNWAF